MNESTRSRVSGLALALGLIIGACAGTDSAETTVTSEVAPTTTAAPVTTEASTTTIAQTSTTTALIPGLASPDEYPVSDDYIVETVLEGLDAATGGLALDAEGNLYTADFGYAGHDGNTLFRVRPDGSVEPFATHATMDQLTGNRVIADGTIYQSSYGSGHVYRIGPDGEVEVVTDQMSGPTAIVVTDERLLVVDCNRNAVYEVFDEGSVEVFAGGISDGMRCPNGMTQDPDGNLYLVNFEHGQLMKISPDGRDLSVLHRFPGGNAHVAYHDGQLFITGREANRIFRYDIAKGDADVVAGTGEAGMDDGPGSQATLGPPNAIVIDAEGNIFFNQGTETGFHPTAIRVLRPVS